MVYDPGIQRRIDDLIAFLATFADFDPSDPFGDARKALSKTEVQS